MRSTTCQIEESGYPHPGCSEFGPPDVWQCGLPGVAVIAFTHTDAEFAKWNESEIYEAYTVCEEHLRMQYTEEIEDPDERAYFEAELAHINEVYPPIIDEVVAVL